MKTANIITLARRHLANNPATEGSARWCLADAIAAKADKQDGLARMWAIRSLAYSVGGMHSDYQAAIK